MEMTLLLNATYEPVTVVSWQRAMTLWCHGKVEIVDTHDTELRAVSFTFKVPSIVRLLRYVRLRHRKDHVPFTRANIYARDNHECQYCGSTSDLTFDHVVPEAQGGAKNWTNIVTACLECNTRKGSRTPEEAGMFLRRKPRRPHAAVRVIVGIRKAPASWMDYLYWNIELDRA
jgi:5-methylcytosine-specific restriction endonuclease McrA